MQSLDSMHVRLDLGHFGWADESHIRESVFNGPRLERTQALGLVVIERHHKLAALVERQPTIGTVGPQHSPTGLAQRRP
jgi:hypothetical protein